MLRRKGLASHCPTDSRVSADVASAPTRLGDLSISVGLVLQCTLRSSKIVPITDCGNAAYCSPRLAGRGLDRLLTRRFFTRSGMQKQVFRDLVESKTQIWIAEVHVDWIIEKSNVHICIVKPSLEFLEFHVPPAFAAEKDIWLLGHQDIVTFAIRNYSKVINGGTEIMHLLLLLRDVVGLRETVPSPRY